MTWNRSIPWQRAEAISDRRAALNRKREIETPMQVYEYTEAEKEAMFAYDLAYQDPTSFYELIVGMTPKVLQELLKLLTSTEMCKTKAMRDMDSKNAPIVEALIPKRNPDA